MQRRVILSNTGYCYNELVISGTAYATVFGRMVFRPAFTWLITDITIWDPGMSFLSFHIQCWMEQMGVMRTIPRSAALNVCHNRGLPRACNHGIAKVWVSILYLVMPILFLTLGRCWWLLLCLVCDTDILICCCCSSLPRLCSVKCEVSQCVHRAAGITQVALFFYV